MKPTLGLAMITNDMAGTRRIIKDYEQYFDKLFITCTDRPTLEAVRKIKKNTKCEVTFFKWEDHFGKARELNRSSITTDYFMWLDTDDIIENPENIRRVFGQMLAQNLDAVYMKYDYIKNDLGEGIGDHWRERMVKTEHFKWAQTRVHETLLAPSANTSRTDLVTILHDKTKAQEEASMARNIKLLLQDFQETKDPRIAMYLGDNLMYLKQWDDALFYLAYLIQNGGWDEDKYRAWLRVAEIHYQNERFDQALSATDKAMALKPEFPDSYFLKASIYNAMEQPKNVYEWVKVGMSKPVPETLSVVDPTLYEYRGIFMGALAALELGRVEEAHKLLYIVLERSPNYELALKMQPLFDEAYYDTKAIERIQWLSSYMKDNGGKVEGFLNSLPAKILCDPRLNATRANLLPTKKWPKGSIAYYCGQAAEVWGPDTLEKGMGGSEEAVVYLSRELARLGHFVTVFNDREEVYVDPESPIRVSTSIESSHGVMYKPWTLLNPNDEFDTFIAWRAPENIRGVNARVKLVDLHDTIQPERVYSVAKEEPTTKFFVKSKYHRSLYPELPDERFVIVGNGIVKEQFDA